MKKMKAFYLVIVFVLLVLSVVMFSGIAQAGAVPDGFIGVPWGASTEQIVKTMNERGYRQLTGATPGNLVFKGAFAQTPCELHFSLLANSFYSASANHCARSDYPLAPQSTYRQVVDELSKKYGPPTDRRSDKLKTNDGKEHPQEGAWWDLVDSRTFEKYSIRVDFGVTWFADNTGDQYVVTIHYWADSLGEKLKKKEY
ncbi:MAG: hypothetical protein C0399_03235 [Syntrophus sp. (in: bacteria)]|nr:hypothetical protein [Syntrophus sp. (in: bacteria)]